MATVDLKDVKKVYPGGVEAVKGVSIAIPDKQLCVLVGPSGCGKSTLLRMIAGLETISAGTCSIDGKVVNAIGPTERDIAMVFQNYALYPHMKVYDNMAYGLRNRGMPKDEIDKRVRATAQTLELAHLLERRPRELSGGQRQRVAMGRAIVRSPKVFLFDEPLSNLDAKLRGQMRVEIKNLQRQLGVTSVYVTHDQLEAMTLADVLVVMNAGLVEQLGAPLDIYEKPASTFVASFIGAPPMNLLPLRSGQLEGAVSLPAIPTNAATIGFRPEDCEVGADGAAAEGGLRLMARVQGVEPVGAESFLYCEAAGGRIVVRVPGRTAVAVGDQLPVLTRREKLHFFGGDGKRV
ncbi:sn-glycerol-3-phosphate ABC transporter ATP-binding protein UgpC [Aminobacter aganoensis]|uniref:sn-glycerol 3-phosphate transport system ATP-binding protein n=1 Tax=Aminobacter aganoensis TaxID=83264 RepID=A0A7X0FBP3_9HYPH|nr:MULTISPECIES: sn-glycerol-3-phosphate ABC transporter ATP-binding protein UgpC [Aminobacter]KQU74147.1 glycerol-3-phosphate ABC transporter ATP-binding protein [Aminobacter sp. DSM 101952]MBB6356769.1 sn-glycerol 3-phosphate transport system ATP-binding protein [Aminobacter aganoensis]